MRRKIYHLSNGEYAVKVVGKDAMEKFKESGYKRISRRMFRAHKGAVTPKKGDDLSHLKPRFKAIEKAILDDTARRINPSDS